MRNISQGNASKIHALFREFSHLIASVKVHRTFGFPVSFYAFSDFFVLLGLWSNLLKITLEILKKTNQRQAYLKDICHESTSLKQPLIAQYGIRYLNCYQRI